MFSPRYVFAIAFLFSAGSYGFAKPPFWKVFVETYHINPNSAIGKAKCLTCHVPPAPPRRNVYGLEVQAALEAANARMVTPEILRSIEKKDADGDGVSNIAEIKAGSFPGDKNSKPAAHVKAKPKAKKHAKKHRRRMAFLRDYDAFGIALIPLSFCGCLRLRRRQPA